MTTAYRTPVRIKVESGNDWKTRMEKTLERYGRERPALLPCLEMVQETQGCVNGEAVRFLEETFNIPAAQIVGIASFYGMLSEKPQGKYVLKLCDSLPCKLNAAQNLLRYVESELGIKDGETTPDNLFTLEVVPCLGLCDKAPGMMINDKTYGPLTEESIREILNNLKGNG